MRLPVTDTAVLLFALPDSIEADRKMLARHSVVRHSVVRQSSDVWRAMRALTQAKVHASGLPLLNSNRLISHQGTFGEQLSAALSATFALGYEHIICIGNDCPDLSVADLRRAARALASDTLPIGADRRGGVYMAGFSRETFDAQTLAQLPWQTHHLADALRNYSRSRRVTITELPVRADINQRVDATAVRWVGQIASRVLTSIRQALLSVHLSPLVYRPLVVYTASRAVLSGRAPPRT